MSPDIEWHVGEDTELETVVKTTRKPVARWRKLAIALAACLGVGVGVIYASIPEPVRPPTPTPLPTVTPLPLPPLEPVIDREARSLSNGDMQAFMRLQDPKDYQRRQDALALYSVWGVPPDDNQFYSIVDAGTIGRDHAWADVIQYRDGQYFRETRFYRLSGINWLRTKPISDTEFWGAEQTSTTDHFALTYHARDADQVQLVASQFERLYAQLCDEYHCDLTPIAQRKIPIVFSADSETPSGRGRNGGFGGFGALTLPSPRLSGLYYTTLDMRELGSNDQLEHYFNDYLLVPAMYSIALQPNRGSGRRGAMPLIMAITRWELNRRGVTPANSLPYQTDLLSSTQSIDLESLWAVPFTNTRTSRAAMWTYSNALIQFIDEQYGAGTVIDFFGSLREAQSLSDAIDMIGLPYNEFDAKWQAWLEQFRAKM